MLHVMCHKSCLLERSLKTTSHTKNKKKHMKKKNVRHYMQLKWSCKVRNSADRGWNGRSSHWGSGRETLRLVKVLAVRHSDWSKRPVGGRNIPEKDPERNRTAISFLFWSWKGHISEPWFILETSEYSCSCMPPQDEVYFPSIFKYHNMVLYCFPSISQKEM